MKIKGIFASVLATAIAGSAFAETKTTFQNNLHSNILVSPAQYNQVTGAKTDLSFGFEQATNETKSATIKSDLDLDATNFRATGIYSFTNIGLKAGMDVSYGATTVSAGSVEFDNSLMTIAPVALYTANDMFTVAMQYSYNTAESDAEKELNPLEVNDTQDVTYGVFTPAFLVSMGAWEAGLVYSTEVDEEATNLEDLSMTQAAEWKIHGRYAVMPELAVGGHIGQAMWSSFDNAVEDDQTTVAANAQWTMDALKLEGILAWNSDFYGETSNMNTANISTIMLEAGADYAVNPTASVGGALAYTTGSDSADNTDYDVNTLGVTVRGNLMF